MAKVMLLCGRLCCGKSTFASQLQKETAAVVLSVDALTLSLFPGGLGEEHDEMTGRVKTYLLSQAQQILAAGVDVILDWGFWKQEERHFVRRYWEERHIAQQWYYLNPPEEKRRAYIQKRNAAIEQGKSDAYFVDSSLFAKCDALFEPPCEREWDTEVT